jgi:hypothetical protein
MKAFGVPLASSIVFDEHDKVFNVDDKYSQEVNALRFSRNLSISTLSFAAERSLMSATILDCLAFI